MLSHYDTLRVDPAATVEQIRESYRIRLQLVHPDRHQGASPEVVKVAEEETERLVEAFRVLSDQQRRMAYDRSLHQDRAFVGGGWRDPEPDPQPNRNSTYDSGTGSDPFSGQPYGAGTNGASAHGAGYGTSAPGYGWTRYPCPSCGWWQLSIPGAVEVTCDRCSSTFVFVTCRSCKERVSVLPTDQWSRCQRCSRKRITPWATAETKKQRARVLVRNGVALLGIPLVILVIVAMRVNDQGSPDGVAYWLVGALLAMCVGLYLTFVVVRRHGPGQDGGSPPR